MLKSAYKYSVNMLIELFWQFFILLYWSLSIIVRKHVCLDDPFDLYQQLQKMKKNTDEMCQIQL